MEIIKKYFKHLTNEQYDLLAQLQQLYEEWNAQINVISRKDMDGFYERHVLHSLAISQITNFDPHIRVVDIGTGGGFPGIPLAILYPETEFVLIDSRGKKIKVVEEVVRALHLKNVLPVHGRVEEWRGEKFDLAITRAVARLNELIKWSKVILKPSNQGLICLKGGDLREEIKDIKAKTNVWNLSDYFDEPFFETKKLTWTEL